MKIERRIWLDGTHRYWYEDEWRPVKEIAAMKGYSKSTTRRWLHSGEVKTTDDRTRSEYAIKPVYCPNLKKDVNTYAQIGKDFLTVADMVALTGIPPDTIRYRVSRGIPYDAPVKKKKPQKPVKNQVSDLKRHPVNGAFNRWAMGVSG